MNSYGTAAPQLDDDLLSELVQEHFDLRPGAIIRELKLRRPIFAKTASGGHFGRNDPDFTWEQPRIINWEAWLAKKGA